MSFGLVSQAYEPVREYAGKDFFMGWDIDANVSYIDQDATPQEILTYVDSSTGHAIIRAGNTLDTGSVHGGSVRITSKGTYSVGDLVLIDAINIPGCSVWPSFLAPGDLSGTGELHLIDGVDGITANQRQLPAGYVEQPQSPETLDTDPSRNYQIDWKLNSERGKGGVFALRIDADEVVMWFWNRKDIPPSIAQAQVEAHAAWDLDPSSWGKPKMVYSAARDGYDIKPDTEQVQFRPQKLVLGVTVEHVGDRISQDKGYAQIYPEPGECIVQSNGSTYWEISYIRTFKFAQAQSPEQKPQLLAKRSQADTDATSSITTLSSPFSYNFPSDRIPRVRPPRPTIFNPTTSPSSVTSTTVTLSNTSDIISSGIASSSISSTISISDPTIETSEVPMSTSTDAPVITQGDIEPTVTTSTTSSQGDSENISGISSTSHTGQDFEITSTVPNVTLGGSTRSIAVTFNEGGAGLVSFAGSSVSPVDGAITSIVAGSSGSGTPSSSSRAVGGTPTSLTSGARVNTGFVTGVDVLVMVVGSLLLVQ
ncbi:hypothetical protein VNI00_011091 [Paramarasmius palmivorus]|uniref:Uncharacterized protein n=1 Tax=Paramarasmius palmivorus TaxID=297713 RepID=A0AAW0CFH5_9AGAR